MRRASAISVLAAICYCWLAPLLFADPESTLPACCRRAGSHHCSMTTQEASTSGAALNAIHSKCPLFPASTAARLVGDVASPVISAAIFAGLASHPAIQIQTEARARVSFSRSRQKRGPPEFLL